LVRLYAAAYPAEIAGLVLVDAWSEGLKEELTPEQWERYVRFNSAVPPQMAGYPEYETIDFAAASAAMDDAAAAHPLGPVPLVVIAKGQPFGLNEEDLGFPPEELERAWRAAQEGLATLAPPGRFEVAAESGHYVQLQQPELVIDAVRAVVEATRDPTSWNTPAVSLPTPDGTPVS
jgi:pimeloyl-ACP methyl ester carboxylesterase